VRTSTIVMIGFAVAFGLLAVFLANAWLNNRAAEQMRDIVAHQKPTAPSHTIVVAARPLKFGEVVSASALREMAWPEDTLPAGAFGKIGELTAKKRVVLRPIAVNEPVLQSSITGPGQRGTLSSVLRDGMKAATIRIKEVDDDVAGFVLPGDHVDVLLTRPGEKKTVNDVVIQNVRVLGVDQLADDTAEKPALVRAVTLEVDETDGQKLALASMVGTLSLLLRKAGEVAEGKTRQITSTDLGNEASPANTGFATIVVTRPTKDSTTQDEYSVPTEHRVAPSAALSGQETARD
jgi:pilus assembly protein CpaB